MDIETYRHYCIGKVQATEDFPFPNLPNVLVFKVAGKMFSATDVTKFASFSIRCRPENIDEIRTQYPAVSKPSYFSERHWNKIVMDHSIPEKILLQWIDDSYSLAIKTLTQKKRRELNL